MHTAFTQNTEISVPSAPPIHNFAARCPRGHRPSQRVTLAELRSPSVRFHCRLCGQSWTPSAADRLRALDFAEASEDWTAAPPSAA